MSLIPFPYSAHATALSQRRHGPFGYEDYRSFKPWLRDEHDYRCVYCLCREQWNLTSAVGQSGFGADHIESQFNSPEGARRYENLCYCCNDCNSRKGKRSLPRVLAESSIGDHISVNTDGTLTVRTPEGEWLRDALFLDMPERGEQRRLILALCAEANAALSAGRTTTIARLFEYPSDVEDLSALRPEGNSRPEGIKESAYSRRGTGTLSRFY